MVAVEEDIELDIGGSQFQEVDTTFLEVRNMLYFTFEKRITISILFSFLLGGVKISS